MCSPPACLARARCEQWADTKPTRRACFYRIRVETDFELHENCPENLSAPGRPFPDIPRLSVTEITNPML